LRSPSKINPQFIDELLKGVDESDAATDTPKHLVEIKKAFGADKSFSMG